MAYDTKVVKHISFTLYKEDYSDYGWRYLCESVGIDPEVKSFTLRAKQAEIETSTA
jgi:hypothetical protein